MHSRSDRYPDRPQAEKLMEYCIGRGTALGPLGERFRAICDQLDQPKVMLAAAVERAKQGIGQLQPTWPERDGPAIVALAHQEPDSQTVSLVLDATTANIAMFAIATHADDREAHVREVERVGESLPPDSYGRANRRAIAAREARAAGRLRAVELAYRAAIEEVVVLVPPERASPTRQQSRGAEIEIEPG
jgi:hypothetical protein